MSNYVPKTKVRWVSTHCTNKQCGHKSEAVDFVLVESRRHTPKCSECGWPMKFNKGDLKDDPS